MRSASMPGEVRIRRRGRAIVLEPVPESWEWLDALAGDVDEDFVSAMREQPEATERLTEMLVTRMTGPSSGFSSKLCATPPVGPVTGKDTRRLQGLAPKVLVEPLRELAAPVLEERPVGLVVEPDFRELKPAGRVAAASGQAVACRVMAGENAAAATSARCLPRGVRPVVLFGGVNRLSRQRPRDRRPRRRA